MSSFSSTLSSSVVLNLEADGGATACRGRRWHSVVVSNDGEGKPDVTQYEEQQGLRGRWAKRGSWMDIALKIDDSVCAPIRRGAQGEPMPWRLECVKVAPSSPSGSDAAARDVAPTLPVLACFHEELGWPHDLGYVLDSPFGLARGDGFDARRKGGWLLLGEGDGVRIRDTRFGGLHPTPVRTWERSPHAVAFDEWSRGIKAE